MLDPEKKFNHENPHERAKREGKRTAALNIALVTALGL